MCKPEISSCNARALESTLSLMSRDQVAGIILNKHHTPFAARHFEFCSEDFRLLLPLLHLLLEFLNKTKLLHFFCCETIGLSLQLSEFLCRQAVSTNTQLLLASSSEPSPTAPPQRTCFLSSSLRARFSLSLCSTAASIFNFTSRCSNC